MNIKKILLLSGILITTAFFIYTIYSLSSVEKKPTSFYSQAGRLEFPKEALEQQYLMTVDPNTGNIPLMGTWKALKLYAPSTITSPVYKTNAQFPNGWKPINEFFANLAITKIVYDPNNTNHFYFCTGEGWYGGGMVQGAGVWKSTDAGQSWEQLVSTDTSIFNYCQDMLVHPANNYIYVATRAAGIQRSTDGGATWETVLSNGIGSSSTRAADIEITNDGNILVSMGIFDNDGIYLSTTGDLGSWTKLENGIPATGKGRIEIATSPSNKNVAYAFIATLSGDSLLGTYKTVDKGSTWTEINTPGTKTTFARKQSWYDLIAKVDPNDENVVAAGAFNLYKTKDGGNNWQQLTRNIPDTVDVQAVHVDHHEIIFKSSDTLYLGNDGGIFRCDNFTDSIPYFYDRNKTYNVTQFYAVAFPSDAENHILIGGTQDNNTLGTQENEIGKYSSLQFGDGAFCAVNPINSDIMYISRQLAEMFRLTKGFDPAGKDSMYNSYLTPNNVLFVNPMELDPNNPELLYMASNQGLWRLADASNVDSPIIAWEQASRTVGTISAIGIATNTPNTIFLGTTGGGIFRLEDAHESDNGSSPKNIRNGNMPSGYVSNLHVDPENSDHVIAIYSNYGIASVWETYEAFSEDNPEWVNHEGDLPNIPIYWAFNHPINKEVCYVATELGVFYTEKLDGENTKWQIMNNGMANVKTVMLKYRPSDNMLVVATYGRGLFETIVDPAGINNNLTWTERGPNNIGGRTRSILIDPNDPTGKTIWSSSVSGGLWKTSNIDSVDFEIEEFITFNNPLTIFPNPASKFNTPNILYEVPKDGQQVVLQVINLYGAIVQLLDSGTKDKGQYSTTWHVSEQLQDGFYFIVLRLNDKVYTKKITVIN